MLSAPDPYGAAANVNIISSRRLSDLGTLASSQRYHTPKATGKGVLSCICYIRYIRYIRSKFSTSFSYVAAAIAAAAIAAAAIVAC